MIGPRTGEPPHLASRSPESHRVRTPKGRRTASRHGRVRHVGDVDGHDPACPRVVGGADMEPGSLGGRGPAHLRPVQLEGFAATPDSSPISRWTSVILADPARDARATATSTIRAAIPDSCISPLLRGGRPAGGRSCRPPWRPLRQPGATRARRTRRRAGPRCPRP